MTTFYLIGEDTAIGDVAVITMGGELDYADSPELRDSISSRLGSGFHRLLLDLSGVTFIDSTAIGLIIGAAARLRASGGGSVAILCPPGEDSNVRMVMEIAGLDATVTLCETRDEALAALSAPQAEDAATL